MCRPCPRGSRVVLKSAEWQCDDQSDITVALDSLPDVVEFLYFGRGGWLPMMVGNDERSLNGNYALYYILSMEEEDRCWCVVRVEVPADTCEFPSVTPRVPACVWSEREVRDMFGLRPVGLPDQRRLVLPDDWPDDLYPLRKDSMDYRQRPMIASEVENYEFLAETGDRETTVVPMGPLHVTSDEPGHFRLFVEGEHIIDADYRLFYVHRGMEKVAESRMNYDAVTFLADRVCGICGNAHSVAYAESRRACAGHRCSPARPIHPGHLARGRAHALSSAEPGPRVPLQRLRHRVHALLPRARGFDAPCRALTGHRKTYGLNLIGGVRRDILEDRRAETLRVIRKLRDDVKSLLDELMSTPNFEDRTKGVGRLDPKIARDVQPGGPVRARFGVLARCALRPSL